MESTGTFKDSPKFTRAQLLLEYIKAIANSLRRYYLRNDQERTRTAAETTHDTGIYVKHLERELRAAIPLERADLGTFADQPKLARSASMLARLHRWAQHVSGPTIWKVGESHIRDALALTGGGPVPGAKIMHGTEYLAALLEVLDEAQAVESTEQTLPEESGNPGPRA